jgi:protein subunit release factor B
MNACAQLGARRWISVKKQVAQLMAARKPVVIEERQDVEEQRVRGSGPGGQCVNVSSNKVRLWHKPTGIIVESHQTRHLELNRRDAWRKLRLRLDDVVNGSASLSNIKLMLTRERNRKQHKEAAKKYGSSASALNINSPDINKMQ